MLGLTDIIKSSVLLEVKEWPTATGVYLDRSQFITASEAASCVRSLGYAKLAAVLHGEKGANAEVNNMTDAEFKAWLDSHGPDHLMGYAARGMAVEDWLVKTLRSMADDTIEGLYLLGDEQVSLVDKDNHIAGTPDGLYYGPDDKGGSSWALLEFKSIGRPVYEMVRPLPRHVVQVQVSLALLNKMIERHGAAQTAAMLNLDGGPDADLDIVNEARITYVNSNNFFDCRTFRVQYDGGEAFKMTLGKARSIFNKNADFGVEQPRLLDPEGAKHNDCGFCAFKDQCRADLLADGEDGLAERITDGAKKPKLTAMPALSIKGEGSKAEALCRKFVEAKLGEKDSKAEGEALKDAVKKVVQAAGGKMAVDYNGDVYVVSTVKTSGRVTLDKDGVAEALTKAGLSIADFEKVGKPGVSVNVTKQNESA